MIILQASHITKSFGADIVLENINLTVQNGERVGLVGPNGAGKTTLLKIVTGRIPSDSGEVMKPKGVSFGYLAQDGGLESNRTIWDEMISVFEPIIEQEKALRRLEKRMGEISATASPSEYSKVMEEYAALAEDFKNKGGYGYQAAIRGILHGLKFGNEHEKLINTLSGGQKTRLALAKQLLTKPDLLILDEPTNYLDMETLTWLEQYLISYPGAVLVVSHDRYFLDSLVQVIYELQRGKAVKYIGNYSQFIQQKKEKTEQQLKQYKKQQEEIAKMEDFVRRNMARSSTTGRAQSRQKMLEKIQRLDKPVTDRSARFSFGIQRASGSEVLKIKDMTIGYNKTALSHGINVEIKRGERVALVGPNGAGKSTLLKTIIGQLRPLQGYFLTGTNVDIGYYEQEQAKSTSTKQVLNELWDHYAMMDEKDIRTVLGCFLFSGDDVYKSTADLSGGERARLSLSKLMLKKANFLMLDEPTNHLDIYSKEVLEGALEDYPGTILFVSHDRYFLKKVATRVVELSPQGVTNYAGDYLYYLRKKKELETSPEQPGPDRSVNEGTAANKMAARQNYLQEKEAKRREEKRMRRLEELEIAIEETEKRISELEAEIYLPEVYQELEILMQKNEELEKSKKALESYYEEWGRLEDMENAF